MDHGLGDRLFDFAINTLKFLGTLGNTPEEKVVRYQLAKSSTSSGANYEEAQSASSKLDFKNKMKISLKEMRESSYWLKICVAAKYGSLTKAKTLFQESTELKKILGSICSKL